MAILQSIKQREMPFLKALTHAKTGETIIVSQAPKGIEQGDIQAHMLGILSLIDGNLYLNDTFVCSDNNSETHGKFFPFYQGVVIHRSSVTSGKSLHQFQLLFPTDPTSTSRNTQVAEQVFEYLADDLEITPITSGKGLILVENKPEQKISLLRKRMFMKTMVKKDTSIAWKGNHSLCIPTPSSVIVGEEPAEKGAAPFTRFYRGHHHKNALVHDYLGKIPEITDNTWTGLEATDLDLFFKGKIYNQDAVVSLTTGQLVGGEEAMISATTGKAVYVGLHGEFHSTSSALVRLDGSVVEANGYLVNDSFVKPDWLKPHAYGLLYGLSGQIRMLVIKDVPPPQ